MARALTSKVKKIRVKSQPPTGGFDILDIDGINKNQKNQFLDILDY
jgi:hypothetical protein